MLNLSGGWFRNEGRSDASAIYDADSVPGCTWCMIMRTKSRKKKERRPESESDAQLHANRHNMEHNRSSPNTTIRGRFRPPAPLRIIITDHSSPILSSRVSVSSTASSSTMESVSIPTPDTPTAEEAQYAYLPISSPPPVLPSPGLSKDNAYEWYKNLIHLLEQGSQDEVFLHASDSEGQRHTLRWSRHRRSSGMSTWELELDQMAPSFEFPGVYGWYTRFGVEVVAFSNELEERGGNFLERDAESVYRACEAMGGTGIVF